MLRISSYLQGAWTAGDGVQAVLQNPASEEPIAEIAGGSPDFAAVLAHARRGGAELRALTFAQRGELLRGMARTIHKNRDALIALAIANGGNTRGDAKFDIDGASGTLSHYADLGQSLGATHLIVDGEAQQLGRSPRFHGQHVFAPRAGVAVFINAFNFPAWGIAEKAACALLAGMPVVAKPATATALVAHRMIELIVGESLLPEGALQLLLGPAGGLLDHMGGHDVLAFTGSSETGRRLRGHERLVAANVRVNVEADSLNSAVLGPDVQPGSPTWDLFVADVVRDMTQKTGQKCTAIRRVMIPPVCLPTVLDDLTERLGVIKVGDPAHDEVGMGPLCTRDQLTDVRAGLDRLRAEAQTAYGGDGTVTPVGAPAGKGFFLGPVLLHCPRPEEAPAVHGHEVFGPVATVMAFDGAAAAADLVARGGGGLVASVYSDDRAFLADFIGRAAPHHGRLYIGSSKVAGQTPGPGTALPQLVHGGPGRAGGGEELGGLRGMGLYMQRTALEGDKALIDSVVRGG